MDTAATLDQYTQDISNLPAELQHLLAELGTNDSELYEIRKRISQKDGAIHKFIKQHGSLTKNPKEGQLYPKIREDFTEAIELQRNKCIKANTALFLTAKHLVKLESDMEKLRAEGQLVVEDTELELDEDFFSSRTTTRANTESLVGFGSTIAANLSQNATIPHTQQLSASSLINSATAAANAALDVNPALKKSNRKVVAVKAQTPTVASTVKTVKRQRTEETRTPEPVSVIPVPASVTKKSTQSPLAEPANTGDTTKDDEQLYCFCQRLSFGEMVGCDNDDCKYEWFHFECVGLQTQPKGKWYCSDCEATMKLKDNKKKRRHE